MSESILQTIFGDSKIDFMQRLHATFRHTIDDFVQTRSAFSHSFLIAETMSRMGIKLRRRLHLGKKNPFRISLGIRNYLSRLVESGVLEIDPVHKKNFKVIHKPQKEDPNLRAQLFSKWRQISTETASKKPMKT